ncbi:hypothetical protein AGMMS50276_20670 [Synergistales bacterium]|nr:hypothetical protein AGMMS50276_20670 [Synergistales bacterium]
MTKSSRRAGFTLVEVLTSLIILSAFYGASLLSMNSFGDGFSEKEARRFAQWFSGLVTKANLSKRSFTLTCSPSAKTKTISVEWQFPTEKEKYTSLYDCVFIRYNASAYDSVYTPQWNTFTPAATIRVSHGRENHYVIISGLAHTRTNKKP